MTQSEGDACPTQWLSDVDCGLGPVVQDADYENIEIKPIVDVYEVPRRLTVFKQATSGQTVEHLNEVTDNNMCNGVGGNIGSIKATLGGPLFGRHSIMAQDSVVMDSEPDEDSKLSESSPLTSMK